MRRLSRRFLRYVGCVQGREAYTGPQRAEIYLTNKCNLDCIACWTFSPLLKGTNQLPPIGRLLGDYYAYRGWSEEGIPTPAKQAELGLSQ